MQPLKGKCTSATKLVDCIAVSKEDWNKLVRAVKVACLATGGSQEECQTDLEDE